MAEGIDDGFAESLAVDLGHIHADQSIEPHADADVLENVFFRFFDQGEDVAGEVVLVDDGRGGGSGEDGAAKGENRKLGEEYTGGIEILVIHAETKVFECLLCVRPCESRLADECAEFRDIGFESVFLDQLRVPSAQAAVFLQDDGFQFLGRELPVFVGDTHVSTAMGIIGIFASSEIDADTGFFIQFHFGDLRIDLRLDVGSDGLGNFPKRGFGYLHAYGASVVSDAEPNFATTVFVEDCRHGIQRFA